MSTHAALALQEALVAATRHPDERARAVGALRGAEMYATTWPTDPTSLRTLLNSSGLRALALFTDERQLEDAALRFGWHGVDGSVPTRRLHISEAIRIARQQQVALVIVDITSDHSLELDQGEIELVSAMPSTRPPSYQGLGPVVSSRQVESANELKRASTRPPPANDVVLTSTQSVLSPTAVSVDAEHHAVSATFSNATTATMAALPDAPSDDIIDALTSVLRDYPEVDWACLVGEENNDRDAVHVAVRIDGAFRKNLAEISGKLQKAANTQGTGCDVLVLDTPEQMKRARAIGLPFYPWRKR